MIFEKILFTFISCFILFSCADYRIEKIKPEKKYFTSSGFALIYDDKLYLDKVVNKRIDNESIMIMHNLLKSNTLVKIINPVNSREVEAKINKKSDYPKIFNIVISQKIASILELDINNPYIEVEEIKVNKIFVAKKTNTFEEEKNVAGKAPVSEVEMSDLSKNKNKKVIKKTPIKKVNFTLVLSDFYYENSANSLMDDLIKKTNINNIYVKKINDNKYRLFVGPFKNFNTLKSAYISLNKLGFENLNILRK